MRRTPLKRTDSLKRTGGALRRSTPLGRGNGVQELGRRSQPRTSVPRRAISPASRAQRNKVLAEGKCRRCGLPDTVAALHPAHVCDRSLGGCDQPECVVPLCPVCHRGYDEGQIDLLPVLDHREQAHAVNHLGIVGALRRITNNREAGR